ncbi:hypothetical protein [Mesorhizobium sp. 128a]
MIVLVEKTLPGGVQANEITKEFVAGQEACIGLRLANWHPAFARCGCREKPCQLVDPWSLVALGQEVV